MGTMYRIDGDLLDDIADAINTAKARPNTVTVENLSVTENDTYTAPSGKAYGQVTVNVAGVKFEEEKTGTQMFEGFTNAEVLAAVQSGNGSMYTDFVFNLGADDINIRAYFSPLVDTNNELVASYVSRSTSDPLTAGWNIVVHLKLLPNGRFSIGGSAKYLDTAVTHKSSTRFFIYHPLPASE